MKFTSLQWKGSRPQDSTNPRREGGGWLQQPTTRRRRTNTSGAGARIDGLSARSPGQAQAAELQDNSDTWLSGVLALEQGAIFTATILSALTVALIERKFVQAGLWCVAAAVLSATGFMHSYEWGGAGAVNVLHLAWNDWATGYAIMAGCFFLAPFVTEPGEGH